MAVAKRLPHVHHRQPDTRGFPGSQRLVELRHAGLGTILAAEPDGAFADQIAHHDPVGVALADRYLVDADRFWPRQANALELLGHVLLVQRLYRLPVELEFPGHIADR